MNAVRSSNDGRVLEFKCAPLEDGLECLEIVTDDQRSLVNLEGLCRVDDVVGSEAEVQPARL